MGFLEEIKSWCRACAPIAGKAGPTLLRFHPIMLPSWVQRLLWKIISEQRTPVSLAVGSPDALNVCR